MQTENEYKSFTELTVWKTGRNLKKNIYQLAKGFPSEEKYRLSDQIIRSSRSVCSCIAEGHGRYTHKDQLHFCIMARGSLSETTNHLIDAFDSGFITEEYLKKFKIEIDEVGKLLNGYITYLRTNIKKDI